MKKVLIILFLFTLIGCWTSSLEPQFAFKELLNSSGAKIYLKSKTWGLTFDHQITLITTRSSQKWQVDSLNDYVFHGLQPFIYEFKNDTLFVYPRVQCERPTAFQSNIPIIQLVPSDYSELFYKVTHDSTSNLKSF